MKLFFRLIGISLLLGCAPLAWAQVASGPKIDRVDIKFVGPASVSEQFIRANLRVKAGDIYLPNSTQDDVHSLYGTGQFYNIRVTTDQAPDGGVILTFVVQTRPRITEIKIAGNKKVSDSKLRKKITVKVGDPLDEQKLFMDVQEMKKLYEKYGYPGTQIKYVLNIDENAGRGTVTFQIVESHKIKITRIDFIGTAAFPQKVLRKQIKTKQHWMFSWLTGSGVFKQDQFDDDADLLTEFYRSHGYLDFAIKDVKLDYPVTNVMIIRYYIYEGRQYKVGSVKISGNKIFNDQAIRDGIIANYEYEHSKARLGPNGLPMDAGDIFTPAGLDDDRTAIQDFYGSKGYIGENGMQSVALRVIRVPNVDTGTMDLEFQVDEGRKSYVEKINIHGNVKTKDKVIRRELAISPGETFDMVRVKISQQRLEGLDYFSKVEMRPEPTDPEIAGRKNLDVDVEEKNTGNLTFGAGFSTIDSLVGYVELTQGNFDLFHPPTFTGGGQKFRLRVQLGTEREDYELSFIEPWFLNRKLQLGVDLYRHDWQFDSPHNVYDEVRTGMKVSLMRALWSDFFVGTVSYTVEDVGISLNSPYHGNETVMNGTIPFPTPQNTPNAILDETGDHLYQRLGGTLAYDTRNSNKLPNHGQRTELDTQFSTGEKQYYRVEMKTDWFFPGIFPGDVLEASGRVGVTDSLGGGDVPFYDRYFLGGLYSLRGFGYRNVAPREYDPYTGGYFNEPVGGDSIWFGSLEYSIPLLEKDGGLGVRFALFYDVGTVGAQPYSLGDDYDDNWGAGFRLNIPHLGPLRLDYGIPIHHDKFNGSGGQFQFGVGYTRQF